MVEAARREAWMVVAPCAEGEEAMENEEAVETVGRGSIPVVEAAEMVEVVEMVEAVKVEGVVAFEAVEAVSKSVVLRLLCGNLFHIAYVIDMLCIDTSRGPFEYPSSTLPVPACCRCGYFVPNLVRFG